MSATAPTTGERHKLAAHAVLEARRDALVLRGRRALLSALLERGAATADDVRDAVPLPAGTDPKCFGPVPGLLARAGIIRAAGYAPTTRAEGHARPVTVWALASADAARNWLRLHPPPPESETAPADAEAAPLFAQWPETVAGAATPAGVRDA